MNELYEYAPRDNQGSTVASRAFELLCEYAIRIRTNPLSFQLTDRECILRAAELVSEVMQDSGLAPAK